MPSIKTPEQFDWSHAGGAPKAQVLELAHIDEKLHASASTTSKHLGELKLSSLSAAYSARLLDLSSITANRLIGTPSIRKIQLADDGLKAWLASDRFQHGVCLHKGQARIFDLIGPFSPLECRLHIAHWA